MATVTPPLILWCIIVSYLVVLSVGAASEFSLAVGGPAALQLFPSFIVENSPGSRPGAKIKCGRVLIQGLPRIKHLNKFANSMKVKVSHATSSGRPPNIDVCFHRNESLDIGMCTHDQWERLSNGLWIKPMSPFDHKVLDIRMGASYSENIEVSLDEEFFLYRILFLVSGIVLMSLASVLSKSLVFYYSGAMAAGALLVILMVLFQGMKLLPTGRKSSLAVFLYSSFVGLGTFLLRYVPRLLRSLLVEIGLSEDMYDPLLIFLIVFLLITGSWLGFWVVRKLVITEDGSVDDGVSLFATWSIRIIASVLILQSSIDPLLAINALIGGIFFSLGLRSIQPKLVRRVYKKLSRPTKINVREPVYPYASPVANASVPRPSTRASYTPVQGQTSKSRITDSETFYSTFHDTPDRRKFAKDEWESFTRESTRKAMEGLVASPDFNRWAVSHADRITLAPKREDAYKQRRWFQWF
ncbi:uncharacterized protein LOC131001838 isoform X2 [Salvia miltiorrhiza]|uniref:uncharacterized protein LOC131001838 isoform X2 n=1 Tax=Salvia miltiorrhiza TaxID=226208 RepID=UPI0025AD8276|nr:uncharacterized protein LOC131001838 isoform X2 [Salvia miltiorrhiza]